ncbi:DUF692 domain-containing protein [Roseospirillum parvum]|uniref:UPF0276 protein SAMN05421742_1085 n=1 Tax=Roseospirillum parvum TaxID=83401 RepID=A0A1G8DFI7_9PROT|nr:DUF692 domain-containing protein [Roseospirillum parvum]SDH56475.1 hypothetical protein SAMN05421742_1085 [Roseospirillum parvum]
MTTAPPLAPRAGIGLKSEHFAEIAARRPDLGFFEIHTENAMGKGGPYHAWLAEIRQDHPLSLHGVGMSLGGAEPPDPGHLARTRALVERYQPALVSEHVALCGHGATYLNDLLPLPYTEESLRRLIAHIQRMQEALGRPILIENPSTYLRFAESTLDEPDFLVAAAEAAGCGLLIDVNNVAVSATNHGFDASAWLDRIPPHLVGEIHLAGHSRKVIDGTVIAIDDHGSPVADPTWALFQHALDRFGPRPTLIEWDANLPPLDTLLAEAALAERHLAALAPDAERIAS